MAKSLLTIVIFALFPFLYSQSIPEDMTIPVCGEQSVSAGAPTNSGIYNVKIPCNTQALSPYIDFYHVRILSGTTFTFLVVPVGNDDYDFAAYLNPNWSNLALTPSANIRGSQNDPNLTGIYSLGLSLTATDTCEPGGSTGYPEPGMVRYFNVQPNDEILIAIDRWSQTTLGYTISFGGDAVLDCTLVGNTYGKCDVDGNNTETFEASDFLPDLVAEYPTIANFKFYETRNDAEAGNSNQVSFPYSAQMDNNPTELFVRGEDSSGELKKIIKVFMYVNSLPELLGAAELTLCDSDGNGVESFDLTQAEAQLVPDPNLYTFKYYTSQADAIAGANNYINPANSYSSASTSIYVRIESGPLDGNQIGCFVVGELSLVLVNSIESQFSLSNTYCLGSSPPVLPLVSENGITGSWFPTTVDTSSYGTTTYTFTPNPGQCAAIYQIDIEISEQILSEFSFETVFCQGEIPPILPEVSDNGITGTWSPSVIDTSVQGMTVYTFTPSEGQCADIFQIQIEVLELEVPQFNLENRFCMNSTPPALPTVSENGFSGTWFPSVIDTSLVGMTTYTFTPIDNQGCVSNFQIQIEIFDVVSLNELEPIILCETNGMFFYDFTTLNSQLTNNADGLIFSYYSSLQNANNGIPIPESQWSNYIFDSLPSGIWVMAVTSEGCESEIVEVSFVEGQEVQHGNGPFTIEYCEGAPVDLTSSEPIMALETGVDFSYYRTFANAAAAINPITNEESYEALGDQIIYVRLEKANRCLVILELELKEQILPNIIGLEPLERQICDGEFIEIQVSSDTSNPTFLWTWGENQSYVGSTFTIDVAGVYTLTVTGENGCSTTEELIVKPAAQPIITAIESGSDYLIISATSGGGGLLEYSLNGVIWQNSPRFDNLIKGEIYTVYVRENGCMIVSYQIAILDISGFISPNGDGYNDVWVVRGIEFSPKTTIKIFDRYGKLFVDTNFEGNYTWDGKYLGNIVPTGDYWYIMEIPSDGVSVAKKFVGHISVRNR